ncbi:FtsK/SpoIIIE domain-containing protein [Bacillus piscicola]|uniref:FtsK/SpoIIIE domain-containing protein n=1 Tax=Bacillus piscicola TaxID=1632684 RepID=UPI001F096DCC|nr:FtsK/SpoIIIE domain-containing protein [Bacillus piscicola]
MLFEVSSSLLMGGLVGYTYLQQSGTTSDAAKIQRICANSGLTVKEGGKTRTMQLLRKTRREWGVEYAYRIPLGLSVKDFENKIHVIQDGLNNKYAIFDITLADIKKLRPNKRIIQQIKQLLRKEVHKEIELTYDGLLKIRVYNDRLTEYVKYDDNLLAKCKGWQVPAGVSRHGWLFHDFEQFPHMIVAGATDKGKSVFLKNVITTLIDRKPDDVSFSLIDLKGGLAFARYRDCAQVRCVAKSPIEAVEALRNLQQSMNDKLDYLLEKGYEDMKEAKEDARNFIVIDEAADLSSFGETDKEMKKALVEAESIIKDIGRRGRAAGYRLIYATQYPTNETLPSQVRQNVSARVCFKLETARASMAVLDETGAEELPATKGRAIYRTADGQTTIQTPYISNDYIQRKIEPHINIRAREESQDGVNKGTATDRTGRGDSLIIEETELS